MSAAQTRAEAVLRCLREAECWSPREPKRLALPRESRPFPPPTNGIAKLPAPEGGSTSFSVEVVDGNGVGVSGEVVTARYGWADGRETVTETITDGDGLARFTGEHRTEPPTLTLESGPESIGPFRPTPGSRLVIER